MEEMKRMKYLIAFRHAETLITYRSVIFAANLSSAMNLAAALGGEVLGVFEGDDIKFIMKWPRKDTFDN